MAAPCSWQHRDMLASSERALDMGKTIVLNSFLRMAVVCVRLS